MFTIGDFARHGRVSVRMLRHYDALGLLRPAHVDPASGYRHYTAAQLARLNRIVALKELGFTLQQVAAIVDERVGAEELRAMLRLRQADLRSAVAAAEARLVQVEARLRAIESEGRMPENDVLIAAVPAVRVAELTAVAESWEPDSITPVITPLYQELFCRLETAGVAVLGPGIAYYADAPEGGGRITVHATVAVAPDTPPRTEPFRVHDLPALERAATIVHRGAMAAVLPTAHALARWIDAHGHRAAGYPREVTLEHDAHNPDAWVTELQTPLA